MSGKTLTQEDKVLVEKAFALQNGDQAGVTISNSDTATLLERLGFDLDDNRINLQKPQYGLDELTEVVGAATSNVHEQRKLAHAFRIFTDKPLTSRLMSLPRLQQTLAFAGAESAREIARLTEKLQIDSQESFNYHRLVQQYLFE